MYFTCSYKQVLILIRKIPAGTLSCGRIIMLCHDCHSPSIYRVVMASQITYLYEKSIFNPYTNYPSSSCAILPVNSLYPVYSLYCVYRFSFLHNSVDTKLRTQSSAGCRAAAGTQRTCGCWKTARARKVETPAGSHPARTRTTAAPG